MKGSSDIDKQDRMRTAIVFVLLLVISTAIMSLANIYTNENFPVNLHIRYEHDRCDYVSSYPIGSFEHTYSYTTIDTQLMMESYKETLSQLKVGSFPLWVNTSSWKDGDEVTIGGVQYSLSLRNNGWRAYREFGDSDYEVLYYHKKVGVLLETDTDRMHIASSSMGFTGYYIRINIEQSNIALLISKATGSDLIINNGLVVGILIQIAIIQWQLKIRNERKKSSE